MWPIGGDVHLPRVLVDGASCDYEQYGNSPLLATSFLVAFTKG